MRRHTTPTNSIRYDPFEEYEAMLKIMPPQ